MPIELLRHETEATRSFDWTLAELLAALRAHRPGRATDPDRTFCVGVQPGYLTISTSGPRRFVGQHPIWGDAGKFEGAMIFEDFTFADVRGILERFYLAASDSSPTSTTIRTAASGGGSPIAVQVAARRTTARESSASV